MSTKRVTFNLEHDANREELEFTKIPQPTKQM